MATSNRAQKSGFSREAHEKVIIYQLLLLPI